MCLGEFQKCMKYQKKEKNIFITLTIHSQGDEMISEDLDCTISKEKFIVELVEELKIFALLHIHIEIILKDCEMKEILFYTKR